ncbi:MAG: FAD-binding oxidoreductase [Kiritimatiellia bacterium]
MNWQTNVTRDYSDYLRDESRRTGRAEAIVFPATEAELADALREARARGLAVAIQGARTGIAAGAVPEGGAILNLSRLNRVSGLRERRGEFFLLVQPGAVLAELRAAVAKRAFETAGWDAESLAALAALRAAPPQMITADPTESSASLGGMVACNASGARSFKYGASRGYVEALRVALADGTLIELRRGVQRARGRDFELALPGGRVLKGRLPAYHMPAVKNASGYYAADYMDLVDLFIGSEGTLGVIAAIEWRLVPEPPVIWGLTAFLPSMEAVCRFVRHARGEAGVAGAPPSARPAAIEYFNGDALALLRRQKAENPAFAALPEIPQGFAGAVYVELHAPTEAAAAEALEGLTAAMAECGAAEETAWLADTDAERERLHRFRHAVPEAVNLLIGERKKAEPGITKLGTDMAVPDAELERVMAMYAADLGRLGLESVIFGHIGNNHVHVNILPRSLAEYEAGKRLYRAWAERVCALGGTISAEHGVGKLKTALLETMYGAAGIAQMRAVKQVLDPEGALGPGNLF